MTIPPFDADGLLPPGDFLLGSFGNQPVFSGHDSTLAEVRACLVDAYPRSNTRARLFMELENLVRIAQRYVDCVVVRVSGEFVTDLADPKYVTVILDMTQADMQGLPALDQWLLHRLFDRREARIGRKLSVYSELIVRWPEDHSRYEEGEARLYKALAVAGSPRDNTIQGGHIEVLDCRSSNLAIR